eukprot:GHVR01193262.1.p1 GENE.GHVR01193262.1~~GHVR01193262.1.p1  ORF type:complete len:343 (+),score=50.93 GHVR01193262.1:40-1068(+)
MSSPLLVTAGYDETLNLWHPHKAECFQSIPHADSHVNCLVFSPDRAFLAAGGNPQIRFYSVASALSGGSTQPVTSYDGHTNNVTSLGFECFGNWFFSSSEDGTVKIWDCRAEGFQMYYENVGVPVHSAALNPNQAEIVIGDQSGNLHFWDLVANKVRARMAPEVGVAIKSVAIAGDGQMMCAANHHGVVFTWQILPDDAVEAFQRFQAHQHYITKCVFSPEGSCCLATASADGTACLWRITCEGGEAAGEVDGQGQRYANTATLVGHKKWVWDVVFSCDGELVVTGSSDCSCCVWSARTAVRLLHLTGVHRRSVTCVALWDQVQPVPHAGPLRPGPSGGRRG